MQILLQQNLFAKVTCSGTRAYLGGFWVQTHLNESIPVITCPQIIVNPQIQIPQIFFWASLRDCSLEHHFSRSIDHKSHTIDYSVTCMARIARGCTTQKNNI